MFAAVADETCVVPEQHGGVAAALLAGVAAMDDDALVVRARELAGEISAAEANLAAVLAEIERREIHSSWECHTIERFAGWHLQQAAGRARALADVGRAMGELPVVAEAVADGTLSFDKAKSIVRVAASDTQGALVELALHATTSQTQRICGKWRKVDQHDNPDPDSGDGTSGEVRPAVFVVRDEDGVELRVRFDHVLGELVLCGLDTITTQIRAEHRAAAAVDPTNVNDPAGVPACAEDRAIAKLTQAEWRALGLVRLAEQASREQPAGLHRSGFDTTVVVHVGIDTLHGGRPDTAQAHPGLETLRGPGDPHPLAMGSREGGCGGVPEPTSEQLRPHRPGTEHQVRSCDWWERAHCRDRPTAPTTTARHRTCAWPGCVATAVQIHHIHHRAAGGHDDIENLIPQCLQHHRHIHTHGVAITIDPDGTPHHWRPDGTEITTTPSDPAPTVDALRAPQLLTTRRLDLGADPHETSRQPRWHGDPLHLADCIDAIQTRRHHALRRTNPTNTPPNLN